MLSRFYLYVFCVCSIVSVVFSGNALAFEKDLYAAVGYKKVTWYLSDSTDAIVYDENFHKQLDFTLAVADNFFVGFMLDIDDEVEENRKLAVQLGFGKWGIFIDKGKITGKFSTDSDLNFNPQQAEFAKEYQYIALYKNNGWGGASQSGIGFAEWKMPSKAHVNYGVFDEVQFVDPDTKYKTIGYFMRFDYLRGVVNSVKSPGFNIETSILVGWTTVTPSDSEASRVRAITGTIPNTDSSSGIGGINTLRFGYYGGKRAGQNRFGWGFSIGYEIQQYGFMLPFDDSVSDEDQIFADEFGFAHGPFAKFAGTW